MKLLDLHEQALDQNCGLFMRRTRKNRKGEIIPSWRCSRKACRTQRSIRHTNLFFIVEDGKGRNNSKMSLRDILLLVYLFVNSKDTIEQLMIKLGHGKIVFPRSP